MFYINVFMGCVFYSCWLQPNLENYRGDSFKTSVNEHDCSCSKLSNLPYPAITHLYVLEGENQVRFLAYEYYFLNWQKDPMNS